MDIVLAAINAKWIHPSLALRLLKANLGELEKECEILEFALRQPLAEKVNPILAARPRILGVSVSIWNHTATLELLKTLNEAWTEKPVIVLGGPEVSWLDEEAEIFHYADYVIRGEGEERFRSLCYELLNADCREREHSAGRKKAVFLGHGGTTVDVDKIASAYRLYTDEDLQRKLVYVEASRGCPFECEFCQAAVTRHAQAGTRRAPPVREFPLDPFLAGMEKIIRRGGRTFKFLDRSFNLDTDRARRIMGFFLDRIKAPEARQDQTRPLCVHFEMVPSRFPPELKDLIRRFPPHSLRLEIGIQTFNRETLSLIRRPENTEETLETLEFLRKETNAILHVDLIAGLPGENLVSFGAGFDRLWRVLSGNGGTAAPFEIQLGILKCLPGTPIARHNDTYGMKYSTEPPYEVLETAAIPAPNLARIKNFARFWEIIVNRAPFPAPQAALVPRLLPPGKDVFNRFMNLSDGLLEHFGKNWGIDRGELGSFLEGET